MSIAISLFHGSYDYPILVILFHIYSSYCIGLWFEEINQNIEIEIIGGLSFPQYLPTNLDRGAFACLCLGNGSIYFGSRDKTHEEEDKYFIYLGSWWRP